MGRDRSYEFWREWERGQLDRDVDSFKDYLRLVNRYLTGLQAELRQRVDEFTSRASRPDEEDGFVDELMARHQQLNGDFPTFLANSLLVSVFTFFEHTAIRFCQTDIDRRLTPQGLSRRVIQQQIASTDSLRRVRENWEGNQFLHMTWPEWEEIENIELVRNCLAHGLGKVEFMRRPAELRAYVQAREEAGQRDLAIINDYLVVMNDYCEHALDTCHAFLRRQLAEVPHRTV